MKTNSVYRKRTIKRTLLFCACVLMVSVLNSMLTGTSASASILGDAIQAGADRVASVQYTDGKWGWPLNAPPTYNNIVGPIGMGQVSAYGQTGDANHLNSAKAAGNALVGQTASWVGTYNPMFLLKLYDATGNTAYKAQAELYFTELAAGTYTRYGVDYDTAGYIALIQNGRSGVWNNLLPWEFAPLTYAASRAGDASQEALFMQAMKAGINSLDSSDSGAVYDDILGLAGGVMGLGWMNEDFDPTSGSFAGASSTSDLADVLAGFQNPNGSWYWHSNLTSPASGDESLQTTAYAMLALEATNDSGQYSDEILGARNYLLGMQDQVDGGWPSYPGGGENAEVDGEIVWALSDTSAVPEPVSLIVWSLLGVGGYVVARRRLAV